MPHRRRGRRLVRYTLAAGAALIVAVVLAWSRVIAPTADEPAAESPLTQARDGPLGTEVREPRLVGTDSSGRPYQIEGEAIRPAEGEPPGREQAFDITAPIGDIDLDEGWVAFRAERGHMDRANGILQLRDQVVVYRHDGHVIETAALNIAMPAERMVAPGPVAGYGPTGQFSAQAMMLERWGAIIHLYGPEGSPAPIL